jgi:hypothetical protein
MGFPDPVLQPWELRALHLGFLSFFPFEAWFVSVIERDGSAIATLFSLILRARLPYPNYRVSLFLPRVEEWRVVQLYPTPSAEV